MNTELKKLFASYNLSDKDIYEYMQIYSILSPEKKRVFVENAEKVITEILDMKKSLASQQQILMGKTLERIEQNILHAKKKTFSGNTQRSLADLKNSLR